MFKVAGVPMVENVVAGYNSCMFAYGQVSDRELPFFSTNLMIIIITSFADGKWQNSHYAWRY